MKVLCIRRHNERIRWCDDEKRRERERDALSSLSYTSFDQLKKMCVFLCGLVSTKFCLCLLFLLFFAALFQRISDTVCLGAARKN